MGKEVTIPSEAQIIDNRTLPPRPSQPIIIRRSDLDLEIESDGQGPSVDGFSELDTLESLDRIENTPIQLEPDETGETPLDNSLPSSMEEMFDRFSPLVGYTVFKLLRSTIERAGMDFEDAISEGNIGLIKAREGFDPDRGNFRSYAVTRIRGAILDAIRDASPIQGGILENHSAIHNFSDKYEIEQGEKPDMEKICDSTGLKPKRVREVELVIGRQAKFSAEETGEIMDDAGGERPEPKEENPNYLPQERIAMAEDNFERRLRDMIVRNILDERMDPLDALILKMRHIEGLSIREVAGILGKSPTRVAQLSDRAEKRFRKIVDELGFV